MEYGIHFIAGTFAGMSGVFVGFPFDTVKTRLQTQHDAIYRNAWHCVTKTFQREGMFGFYKGLSAPLLGDAITNSVIFGVYGLLNQMLWGNAADTSYAHAAISGAGAGVVGALFLSPIELIKVRLQVQTEKFPNPLSAHKSRRRFDGPLDVIQKTLEREGLRGLTVGLSATMLRDVPAFSIYFCVYEFLKVQFARFSGAPRVEDLGAQWQMLSGALTGAITWILTYPQDVVKSRLQTEAVTSRKSHPEHFYSGFWDCARKSYQERGLSVFYKGIETSILRSLPVNATIFFVYESIIKFWEARVAAAQNAAPISVAATAAQISHAEVKTAQ